jgi:hypothetical protein
VKTIEKARNETVITKIVDGRKDETLSDAFLQRRSTLAGIGALTRLMLQRFEAEENENLSEDLKKKWRKNERTSSFINELIVSFDPSSSRILEYCSPPARPTPMLFQNQISPDWEARMSPGSREPPYGTNE